MVYKTYRMLLMAANAAVGFTVQFGAFVHVVRKAWAAPFFH